jgi:phage terminase large subunit
VSQTVRTDRERYVAWATTDPVGWASKVLGADYSPIQAEMATAVRDHEQVAVRSCHASGKTWLAGRLALHWVAADSGSIAILTGPTFRQVQENSWAELVSAYRPVAGLLSGRMLEGTCRLRMGPRWGVLGFATDNPINFSGFHAERVLIIVDEASGVDESLYLAIEGLRSAGHVRLLLLSQGTQTAGTFYNAFHDHRQFWHTVTISAFDTPNFQPEALRDWLGRDPGIDPGLNGAEKAEALQQAWRAAQPAPGYRWPKTYLVNPSWAVELGAKYGLDSDEYVVRVLGGFVTGDPYALIPLHWMERARLLVLPPSGDHKTWMGLDIAYRGDDDSAMVIRRGPVVLYYEERHGHDTVQVAGWAAEATRRFGVTDVNLDAIGVGAGMASVLRPQVPGVSVHEINAGSKARDSEHYLNFNAEMLWGLRERFEANEISLSAVPRDALERMSGELTGRRWTRTPSGKVQIEPKDGFKARLGRSPDAGDALALAFAVPSDELAVYWAGDDGDPFDDW